MSVDWSPQSNSKSRANSTDSDDGIPKSRNPLTRVGISSYITEDEPPPPPPLPPPAEDGSDVPVRPARRRVVSMDSEADERAPRRERKPRRQMSEIEEDSSITRARRQSMSAGNAQPPSFQKPPPIVKGMDPFVAMLPRAHRVLKYRTIFAKLDVSNTGSLTLPLVEEGLRMLGFDTVNMDVRATVGAHFEAVAKMCGVHPKELSDYFEAQASNSNTSDGEEEGDEEEMSVPLPQYLVFSSLHFVALLEELRVKIRPKGNNSNNDTSPSSPAPFIGDLRKGKSLGNAEAGDGSHRRMGMKQSSSSNILSRGSMRWGGSFMMKEAIDPLLGEPMLYKLSIRLVRVRGLKSSHNKQKVFHWFVSLITNPFGIFNGWKLKKDKLEDDEEDDEDNRRSKSKMKKGSKYMKVKQNDDQDSTYKHNGDGVVIIEAEKLKRQQKRELKKQRLLRKKRQEAICGDVSNYDQFEVGVLLLGMEKGNTDHDDEEEKGKVLPVSTLKSPYFDGEANLDDVMFARHVEFADVQQSPSSIFSSPSVGLEFRYSHHSLNNKELSAKSSRSSMNLNAHHHHHHPHHVHHNDHHPSLKKRHGKASVANSKDDSLPGLDEEGSEHSFEEEYPEHQRLLGWCDVSLQKSMERHVSRQNRKQRKRAIREEKREQKNKLIRLQQRAKANRLARASINMGDDNDGFENIGSPRTASRKHAQSIYQQEQEDLELKELEAGIEAAKLLEKEEEDDEGSSSGSDEEDDDAKATPWDALKWYPILSADGVQVGEAYIGVRFDEVDGEDEDDFQQGKVSKLNPVEQLLFKMYDTDGDGLLSPAEFSTLVHDLRQVHGDIDAIAGRTSHPGCLGKVVGLPDSDLLSFIKYNHTLSNLVAVNHPGQHWSEEMGGVAMNRMGMVFVLTLTLLYSFTVNALVEIIFWNISSKSFLESGFKPTVVFFVKTIVDTIGASVLKELLLFSNLHSLPPIIRIVLNLSLVSLIFGSVIVIMTSKLMTDEQIKIVTETFLAVWFLSRITEVFHLGTLWAFKVSYGSSVGCNFI